MRTHATARLSTTLLGGALVIVALIGVWGVATAADSEECSPATCTSPVMGPGDHVLIETC